MSYKVFQKVKSKGLHITFNFSLGIAENIPNRIQKFDEKYIFKTEYGEKIEISLLF